MSIGVADIRDRVLSHAQALGVFASVNGSEPKSAPPSNHYATWFTRIDPVRSSGLDSTTVRLEFAGRLYGPMIADPQDDVDGMLLTSLDALMIAYSGDFTLGGKVRSVDLLGTFGPGLSAQGGYLDIDGKKFRVIEVTLPLIVNDVWSQAP